MVSCFRGTAFSELNSFDQIDPANFSNHVQLKSEVYIHLGWSH